MEVSPRRLVILGATGTVGSQALKLLAQSESPLQVVALSAHSQIQELQKKSALQPTAQQYLTQDTEQREALLKFLTAGEGYDLCLNAMVGAAGLPFSMAVVGSGRDLALANKESLVCAGELLMSAASSSGSRVLPVDSEDSAIAQ
ncbi:MAG: hypothetical protein MK213_05260 [Planctomycetes bacterium]|nr:hypothetical protein [Planctomycetota bacterium]